MDCLKIKLLGLALISTLGTACSPVVQTAAQSPSENSMQIRAEDLSSQVMEVYSKVLGRSPEAYEVRTFVLAINNNQYTLEALRFDLADSEEAKEKIQIHYLKHFKRMATEFELSAMQLQLATEDSIDQIAKRIADLALLQGPL